MLILHFTILTVGDIDGTYDGVRYFEAVENHGIFVQISQIVSIFNKEVSCYYAYIYINAQVMHVETEKMWAPCRKVKNTFLKKIHEYVESGQLSF